MIIGVPKEIKAQENRVAMVQAGVKQLTKAGHRVLIEQGAGQGSGVSDEEYRVAGAEMIPAAADVWKKAEMVVKVKEPLSREYRYFRPGLILFTYLHLAPLPELTGQLLVAQVSAVGYETVQLADGSLPLLAPMSEVAGRLAVQVGARYLEKEGGGKGILLGGAGGVEPGRVLILGSGTVGQNSARVALGMGSMVMMMGRNPQRLAELRQRFPHRFETFGHEQSRLEEELSRADLTIGAVLVPGGAAPKLVTRKMLKTMQPGSVVVDVAIDQGGCFATSQATTHREPVYIVDSILHYCVANMPGAVPRTSTYALTQATLPYIQNIADHGLSAAVLADPALLAGVNTHRGRILNQAVARAQGVSPVDNSADFFKG
ncbi:MAG: alanine dehydrogenase [Proteobacteria bacterium]|nr:alanine dehydrogenase [Pseudomonadota bacterium]MBU1688501.1 alanine dehydrogenase [Pseudomonadota bacterium]